MAQIATYVRSSLNPFGIEAVGVGLQPAMLTTHLIEDAL